MNTKLMTADRVGGLIWIVFGAAVIYGSWMMDRLETLGIPPSTAPGVVPGLLGGFVILFGLVLVLRRDAVGAPAFEGAEGTAPIEPAPADSDFNAKRAALSAFLCLAYGGALLGSGIPYWLLTTAFLFLHIVLLDETTDVPARFNLRRVIFAAILAPAFATAVTLVFQYIFLVRLP
jgi:putative tricarboxylic transport membrane protein